MPSTQTIPKNTYDHSYVREYYIIARSVQTFIFSFVSQHWTFYYISNCIDAVER